MDTMAAKAKELESVLTQVALLICMIKKMLSIM